MQLINLHITAFAIALMAVVYSQILTEPKQLLNCFYVRFEEFLNDKLWSECKGEWRYKIFSFPVATYYIFNPLIGCYKCVAGQIALWFFFYKFGFDFPTHIYFISLTIFISIFINFIYGRIKNA